MRVWTSMHRRCSRWIAAVGMVCLIAIGGGCATSSSGGASESSGQGASASNGGAPGAAVQNLDATVWFQISAEYEAITRQTFRVARAELDRALEDESRTAALEQDGEYRDKPPAVILDVDETVLDNSAYSASRIREGKSFSIDSWNAWCRREVAPPVPGAVEFANYAHDQGVTVFYVTNREHKVEEATRDNLRKEGFPLAEDRDVVMTKYERDGWEGSKTPRRRKVAEDFRVLLMMGDNLGDFIEDPEKSPQRRAAAVDKHSQRWGKHWFVLPNPMYGHWESAALGGHYSMEAEQKIRRKLEALDMPEEL